MKKNKILRLGLLALALTLVTGSLVSGTFAKYVTTFNGTDTVSVASWSAVLKEGTTAITDFTQFNLFNTSNDVGIASSGEANHYLIAPGSGRSYTFSYDTTGTQVDHKVEITLKNTGASLATVDNLSITIDDGDIATEPLTYKGSDLAAFDDTGAVIANVDVEGATTAGGISGTYTITWLWEFGPESGANDAKDTEDGENAIKGAVFELAFAATQLDGTAAPY